MKVGQAIVEIGGDNSSLKKSLSESGGLVSKFAGNMAAVQAVAAQGMQKAGGGFAGIALNGLSRVAGMAGIVGAATIALANNTARAANEFNQMSASAGMSAQDLTKLAYAFNVGGVATQDLAQGLKGLAVKMNEAASGNAGAQDTFKALGVEITDTSGKLRPIQEVLLDVAEAFKRMPDGAQKSALAVKLMEEAGLKMIPVFNNGAEAIKQLGAEAEKLGLVFTKEQIAAAKEWEENVFRLKAAGSGLAREVGNEVVPQLARLTTVLLENRTAGLSWFDSIGAMFSGTSNPAERIVDLTKKLELLRAKQAEMAKNGSPADKGLDQNILNTEAALAYFEKKAREAAKSVENAEKQSATKRADLEKDLADKKAELAKYVRFVQTGEQGLIDANTKASVDRQIADQQRLADAVRGAWEKTRGDAAKARADAGALGEEASRVRTNAQDRAAQMRDANLSEKNKAANNASRAEDMLKEGRFYTAAAGAAQLDGRAEQFEKYAKQADEFLKRAERFAEASGKADLVEETGKQQEALLKTKEKAKQAEANELEAQAGQQAQALNEIEARIQALQESARNIQVKLKTDELVADIAAIEAQLAQLTAPRQIPVSIQSTSGGPAPADAPARAFGGPLPGRALHDRSDNMLYWGTPGEWVIQRPAVRYWGPEFLAAINAMRLPKFAMGGELRGAASAISRLDVGSFSAKSLTRNESKTPVVLNFGNSGSFTTEASGRVAEEIVRVFKKTALAKGRR